MVWSAILKKIGRVCWISSLLWASAAKAVPEVDASNMPSAPMREQVLSIAGDPERPVTLQATLFEPPGSGPFPLAVMNHGADGDPRNARRYRISFSIDYRLSRGYAVIIPMMRGFAGSGGAATTDGCDYARTGKSNARDILAAIVAMKSRPEIDTTRVLVMGQSFGGWNSLAVTTIAPPEVKGIVNFVGGLRSSSCDNADSAMREAMGEFGREAHVPSLWFYGERDALFPARVWHADYAAYTRSGGQADLVDIGPMNEAHNLLGHGEWLNLWVPKVDAYLAERGLPNREIHPEYMPTKPPLSTNYALLSDEALVPLLSSDDAGWYHKFLVSDYPRALVIGQRSASIRSKGFDPIADALADCKARTQGCGLYAYNEAVVWQGPPAGMAARIKGIPIFGRLAKPGGNTILQRLFALGPDCAEKPLPDVSVPVPSENGIVQVDVQETAAISSGLNLPAACGATQKIKVASVRYEPKLGFYGTDFVSVRISEIGKAPQIFKYAVHVPKSRDE